MPPSATRSMARFRSVNACQHIFVHASRGGNTCLQLCPPARMTEGCLRPDSRRGFAPPWSPARPCGTRTHTRLSSSPAPDAGHGGPAHTAPFWRRPPTRTIPKTRSVQLPRRVPDPAGAAVPSARAGTQRSAQRCALPAGSAQSGIDVSYPRRPTPCRPARCTAPPASQIGAAVSYHPPGTAWGPRALRPAQPTRSTNIAMPMPPATHIDSMP
jgi:hypothetical protein